MEWSLRGKITEGNKLLLRLVVHTFKFLYLLPDGSREKKEWLGWSKSLIILAAFPRQLEVQMESIVGNLVWLMDWTTSPTLCNFIRSWAKLLPNQAVMQPNCMLSMMHLYGWYHFSLGFHQCNAVYRFYVLPEDAFAGLFSKCFTR